VVVQERGCLDGIRLKRFEHGAQVRGGAHEVGERRLSRLLLLELLPEVGRRLGVRCGCAPRAPGPKLAGARLVHTRVHALHPQCECIRSAVRSCFLIRVRGTLLPF
jgi:hypothetical protein